MEMLGGMLALTGFIGFWAAIVGLIKPTWIKLASRKQALGILTGMIALTSFGGAIAPPLKPDPAPIIAQADADKAAAATAKQEADKAKDEATKAKAEAEKAKADADTAKQEADKIKAEAEQMKADLEKAKADFEATKAQQAAQPPPQEPPTTTDPSCKLAGKVVEIADGDTLTLLDSSKTQHKIRLQGIDAPEKGQGFGNKSKDKLSEMVGGKDVCVDWTKEDKYGRKVGNIKAGDVDVNLEMVKSGLAWHFKKYESEQSEADRTAYDQAEKAARSDIIGLWSEPDPIAPWDFRDGKTEKPAPAPVVEEPQETCGNKRYCKQMATCDEAKHYLNDCGVSKLDKDGDGVPCESLCK